MDPPYGVWSGACDDVEHVWDGQPQFVIVGDIITGYSI